MKLAFIGMCALPACSLWIADFDECQVDAECASGLICRQQLCVTPPETFCRTDPDCRTKHGYGSRCTNGACEWAPPDPACSMTEPPELASRLGGALDDRLVFGAVFKLRTEKELARAQSVRLAIKEMNEVGGIIGKPLGVVFCDNDVDESVRDDAEETRARVSYLAGELGVPVIIGPSSSGNAIVSTTTLVQEHLATVIISPSATGSSLTDLVDRFAPDAPYGLFWRTCPSDALQAKVLAAELARAHLRKVAVLYQRDPYGQGLEEEFRADLTAMTTTITYSVMSRSFALDLSSTVELDDAVAELAAGTPDAILVISSDAGRTVRVLDRSIRVMPSARLFLTDGSKDASKLLDPNLSAELRAAIAGARGTAPARPEGTAYDTFANHLREQSGVEASDFSFLAHSYDAAYAAAFAMVGAVGEGAGLDGYDVGEGLAKLAGGERVVIGPTSFPTGVSRLHAGSSIDVDGTSGPLDFDATTGEAAGPVEVWRVDGSGFVTLSVEEPES